MPLRMLLLLSVAILISVVWHYTALLGFLFVSVAVKGFVNAEAVPVGSGFYHLPSPESFVIEEDRQPFHDCPACPEVLLFRLSLFIVDHRNSAFIGLDVITVEHLAYQ